MGGAIGIGLAAVGIGALAFATGGAGLVFGPTLLAIAGSGFLIGQAIGTMYFMDKSSTQTSSGAQSQEFSLATASEGISVKVIFGAVRINGNYIRYDSASHYTSAIYTESSSSSSSSGKGDDGGGSSSSATTKTITGYQYFGSWETGLCMGPLDAIKNVWASPGEDKVFTSSEWTPFTGDYINLSLSGTNYESGPCRIYRGSSTQTRVASGDYYGAGLNYRNLCFASYYGYCVGNSPAAKTHLFELLRLPKCNRDNGTTVDELVTRGSLDTEHAAYYDANPAAILYEILTNKVWGRGASSDLIDEESFVMASSFFAENNIGMSFTIDQQTTIDQVRDIIKSHTGLISWWNGEKFKCRNLHDTSGNYLPLVTLNASKISDLEFSRPTWESTINEVRGEFINRDTWKSEIVITQDLASFQELGEIISKRITFTGFSNRDTCERQVQRVLRESTYPFGTYKFKMNQFNRVIEPGDVIRVIWDDFSDSRVTGYIRIVDIDDSEQSSEGVTFTALEEFYLPATTALNPIEEVPTPQILGIDTTSQGDVNHTEGGLTFKNIAPVRILEPNCYFNRSSNDALFLLCSSQKGANYLSGVQIFWSLHGVNSWQAMGTLPCWAITGELTSAYAITRSIDRYTSGFTFTLTRPADAADMLSSASKVTSDSDSLENLLSGNTDLLLIGNEIMAVGRVQDLGGGTFRATNLVRGLFSTPTETHSIDDVFAFIPSYTQAAFAIAAGALPINSELDFSFHDVIPSGVDPDGITDQLENGGMILELNKRPFAPVLWSKSGSGTVTFKLRPRFRRTGAGIGGDLATDFYTIRTTAEDLSVLWQAFNGSGTAINDVAVASYTFIPEDGVDIEKGVMQLTLTPPIGSIYVRFWASRLGRESVDYLDVTL